MASALTFPAAASSSFPSSFDPDMDSFFDFDNNAYFSPPTFIGSSTKVVPSTETVDPTWTMSSPEHADERQTLPPPSHEYGLHRQQTTMAYNMNAINDSFALGNGNGKQRAAYSVESAMTAPLGFGSGLGLNTDFDMSSQSFPFFDNHMSSMDDFADPMAEFDETHTQVNRMYPGMHSQQAQQATFDGTTRQRQPLLLQQQFRQQALAQQNVAEKAVSSQEGKQMPGSDFVVEEKISRLLDHIRQSSTSSSADDEANSPEHSAQLARMRKDDDDMDEDERLLASEEGKKLSSKERRQLRNKVSARAFRSRRKGYISQLEGEVASKANEVNELKSQNHALQGQITQLTHLTQTLLRHSAFSSFLNDLSNDPSILASIDRTSQTSTSNVIPDQHPTKQEPAVARQDSLQVGMSMIPESSLDFSMLNLGTSNWSNANSIQNYQPPSVFAVFDVPGPSAEDVKQPYGSKPTLPLFPELPAFGKNSMSNSRRKSIAGPRPCTDVSEFTSEEKQDPVFALYLDEVITSRQSAAPVSLAARLLESSLCGKAPVHFRVAVSHVLSFESAIVSIDNLFAGASITLQSVVDATSG